MPDVQAVVHPHGVFSLAVVDAIGSAEFTKALERKNEEYGYYVGKFTSQPWMREGTPDIAEKVVKAVKSGATVVMMEDHGTVAVGKNMQEALGRAESLEKMAQRLYITEQFRMGKNLEELLKLLKSKK